MGMVRLMRVFGFLDFRHQAADALGIQNSFE
jgi:hypothetical protein